MTAGPYLKAIAAGLLLAGLHAQPGSAVWSSDPSGLGAAGLVALDPRPVVAPRPGVQGELASAVAEHKAGRPAVALGLIARAVLRDPTDGMARRALGVRLMVAQDYDAALVQFRAARKHLPGDAALAYEMAWAYQQAGQPADALANAREAVARRPLWPHARMRLGLILVENGQEGDGMDLMRVAALGHVRSAEVCYEVGNFHLTRSAYRQSIPYFEATLELEPEHSYAANNLGNAYKGMNSTERARHYYMLAIATNPRNPNPHNGLGVISQSRGDLTKALVDFETAIRLAPDYMDAHYNAGVLLLQMHKLDEALRELRLTCHLRPDFAPGYFHLGEALYRLGRIPEAEACYRHAAALDPALRPPHPESTGARP